MVTLYLIGLAILVAACIAWMVLTMVLINNLHRRLVYLTEVVKTLLPTHTEH